MIEGLKHDDIIQKVGGRFKLTALLQKRWLELLRKNRPLVPSRGLSDLETAIQEIMQGKVEAVLWDGSRTPDETES